MLAGTSQDFRIKLMSNPLHNSGIATVEELRDHIFRAKVEHRSKLAQLPVVEKLRIMEEMRDFTLALQSLRDENKARSKDVWQRGLKLNPTVPLGLKIQNELKNTR